MTKIVFGSGSPPKIIRNSKCFLHSSPSVGSFGVVLFVAGIHTPEEVHITIEDFCDLGLSFSSFLLLFLSHLLVRFQDVDIPLWPASVMAPMHVDPDDNISYRIWIGTIVPVVPATIITVMRFTARLVWQVGLWWDDYTIAVALVINWAMAATRWAQILMYDYGQHTQFVPGEKVANFQKVCTWSRLARFKNAWHN